MNQYIFWLIILWLVDIAGILIMHKLEEDAWKTFLRTLRTTLDMEMLTCSLDGESIQPFIDDIKRILAEYDK